MRVSVGRFIEQAHQPTELLAATDKSIEGGHHRGAVCTAGNGDAIAAATLDLIHGAVRRGEERFRIATVCGE